MITIIDSGGANIASIQFSLARLGVSAQLSNEVDVIKKSSHIILPGVGSAGSVMQRLNEFSLIEVIRSLTQPVLGICLGMQILFDFSEEGDVECLGLIPGRIKKLSNKLIVPHMGWNTLNIIENDLIMKNVPDLSYAYFIHSYAASVGKYTSAITSYGENSLDHNPAQLSFSRTGIHALGASRRPGRDASQTITGRDYDQGRENFSAAVHLNNFYGTQFHPERSSVIGSNILKNFLEL